MKRLAIVFSLIALAAGGERFFLSRHATRTPHTFTRGGDILPRLIRYFSSWFNRPRMLVNYQEAVSAVRRG